MSRYELRFEIKTIDKDITYAVTMDRLLDALNTYEETDLQNVTRWWDNEMHMRSESLLSCNMMATGEGTYRNVVALSVDGTPGMTPDQIRKLFKTFLYINDESKILRHLRIDNYEFEPKYGKCKCCGSKFLMENIGDQYLPENDEWEWYYCSAECFEKDTGKKAIKSCMECGVRFDSDGTFKLFCEDCRATTDLWLFEMNDGRNMFKVNTERQFLNFLEYREWDTEEQFKKDTGCSFEDVKGRDFCFMYGGLFLKCANTL